MVKQKAETEIEESSRCPNCGEERLVPIAYGFPNSLTMQRSEEDKVVLGGCIITGDDPDFRCSACQHDVWMDGRTHG